MTEAAVRRSWVPRRLRGKGLDIMAAFDPPPEDSKPTADAEGTLKLRCAE